MTPTRVRQIRLAAGPFAGQASGVQPRVLAATRVALTNFRSYARTELTTQALPVVLAGANGTGKTNLLEAISLLSPGRGLRGAKLAAIQRKAPADTDVGPKRWGPGRMPSRTACGRCPPTICRPTARGKSARACWPAI